MKYFTSAGNDIKKIVLILMNACDWDEIFLQIVIPNLETRIIIGMVTDNQKRMFFI